MTSSFKNWLYTLNLSPRRNLMVIHDQEKINISFCTYSKRLFFSTERKKYIYVICIFCKLEKNIRKKKPDLLFMVLEFLICKERQRTRELIRAPDGVQLSLKLILDDRRLGSVFHHLWGLRIFTPCVFFFYLLSFDYREI